MSRIIPGITVANTRGAMRYTSTMTERLTNRQGFTMTELMVTVAIIGIAATMAVPNFRGTINHLRLNDATRTMAGEMLELRQRAVKENSTFWLRFPSTNPETSYEIRKGTVCNTAAVVQTIDMNERYPNVTAEASATCFQFSSRGFFPSTPFVRLRRTDQASDFYQICVRISGTVKVQESTAACT